jgi:hypothetical protein
MRDDWYEMRDWHEVGHPRAAGEQERRLSPPIGVVAILIDPACCHRTAPCPHRWAKG